MQSIYEGDDRDGKFPKHDPTPPRTRDLTEAEIKVLREATADIRANNELARLQSVTVFTPGAVWALAVFAWVVGFIIGAWW